MSVWLAETLIATTLLMALVMMMRRPVARWLGAGAAYWLWALPMVRMLLPALPERIVAPSPLQTAVDQSGIPDFITIASVSMPADTAPGLPWLEIGVAIWLTGMVVFLMVQLVGYFRFRQHMLAGSIPFGQEGRIRIISSPQAGGPLAFGILRPYIVLPVDFAHRFDTEEQAMAIAHERAHHGHGDLAANLAALLLVAVHWCNPVAWIAYRAYRADQEQACDARVLALYGQDLAHVYGRAILKAAGGRQFAGACHLTHIAALKGRLKMLSNHEMSLRRISLGMALVGLMTVAGLALTASGGRAAQQVAAIAGQVETVNFNRLSALVAQPAQADEPVALQGDNALQIVAEPSNAVVPVQADHALPTPPPPPSALAADMVPPVPPAPPAPPAVDAGAAAHAIPSGADIRRQIPNVDVRNGCEGDRAVNHQETVDADGRRHIRVRICDTAIKAQAAGAARAGLVKARAEVARAIKMSDEIRAEVLRDLDEEIARIDTRAAD
ncbi:Signal transducer regulating beta-lactamase production, contains metallopeptidase domain [Sphingobium faniae]|nr:Signal transducer regulating beta-lactamase production, contains metallopeptidase domain [Sphingobium faniae]